MSCYQTGLVFRCSDEFQPGAPGNTPSPLSVLPDPSKVLGDYPWFEWVSEQGIGE